MRTLHEVHDVNPRCGKRVEDGAGERANRSTRHVCSGCLRRTAKTRVRGRYVSREDHDLCRQCWRTGKARETLVAEVSTASPEVSTAVQEVSTAGREVSTAGREVSTESR